MAESSIEAVTPACEIRHMQPTSPAPPAPPVPNALDSDAFDYGTDADPDQEAIARAFAELDKLTLMAERATAERKRAEEVLQKHKQLEERLLQKDIPELLTRMRLNDCTTLSGIEVKVKREIKASLPGNERVEDRLGALHWLVEHGHGGVIKNHV